MHFLYFFEIREMCFSCGLQAHFGGLLARLVAQNEFFRAPVFFLHRYLRLFLGATVFLFFFLLWAIFCQILRGPFSAVSTPSFASN